MSNFEPKFKYFWHQRANTPHLYTNLIHSILDVFVMWWEFDIRWWHVDVNISISYKSNELSRDVTIIGVTWFDESPFVTSLRCRITSLRFIFLFWDFKFNLWMDRTMYVYIFLTKFYFSRLLYTYYTFKINWKFGF